MNEEDYLKRVRRALWKIDAERRKEIILELREDIEARLSEGEKLNSILKDMPRPKILAKEYVEIYGFSMQVKVLFVLLSAIISLFTISVLPFTSVIFYGSPGMLIILALLIFYISNNMGMKFGFLASSISATVRILTLYSTSLIVPLQGDTFVSELITSLIILLIPLLRKK